MEETTHWLQQILVASLIVGTALFLVYRLVLFFRIKFDDKNFFWTTGYSEHIKQLQLERDAKLKTFKAAMQLATSREQKLLIQNQIREAKDQYKKGVAAARTALFYGA